MQSFSRATDDGQVSASAPADSLRAIRHVRRRKRWPLHVLLFLATLVTTTIFGFALVESFAGGHQFDIDWLVTGYARLLRGDARVWMGLQFSGPLLLILLAHEFGHYFACRHWRVHASLPYFLPSPTLFGTLGAFIRIRSPIYRRASLFDIGISGPIAGFVVLLPVLVVGICLSHATRTAPAHSTFMFGTPLAIRVAELLRFPGIPARQILLHPTAMAAWVGLLATAVNLLPMGQLDGGHVLYALLGERWHRVLSNVFLLVLVVFGFWYWAWWLWAILMFIFGRRHPLVYDTTPLHGARVLVGAAGLLLFVLSISIVPVYTSQ